MKKRNNKLLSKIGSLVFYLIVISILITLYSTYKTHYFNQFTKAEYNRGISKFTRDKGAIVSSVYNSYKIK